METLERLLWLPIAVAGAILVAYIAWPLLQQVVAHPEPPRLIACTEDTMFVYVEPGYRVCWDGQCRVANSTVVTAPASANVTVYWPGGASTFACR